MEKIPYGGKYPSTATYLIREGVLNPPRQKSIFRTWASGIDITYILKNMTPTNFARYSDALLLLTLQECERYKTSKWKFASFEARLGRLGKGKDLPEVASFQAAMHDNPRIMIYGEQELGYEVPQKYFLIDKVKDILDIARRYKGKVSQQNPYKVIKLIISIREENK